MLKNQQEAPDFNSVNQNNQAIRLSDYAGKNHVVLYFYPKDDTPGCTIEANQFTELGQDFSQTDTIIIGVSKDPCESHRAFIDKFGLTFDLLADTSGEICNAYGVWQEKEKNGIKKMGIVRSTFVIDKTGRLAHVEYGVTADGHAAKVLEFVKTL